MRPTLALTLAFAFAAANARSADRDGFLIGFSLGGGTLDCWLCESSGAYAGVLEIGASLNTKVALLVDTVAVGHDEMSEEFTSFQLLAAARYWPSSRFWVQGGLGFGQNERRSGIISVWGPSRFAFGGQAGVEVVQRGRFALELRIRYGRTASTPAASHVIGVLGFTWY